MKYAVPAMSLLGCPLGHKQIPIHHSPLSHSCLTVKQTLYQHWQAQHSVNRRRLSFLLEGILDVWSVQGPKQPGMMKWRACVHQSWKVHQQLDQMCWQISQPSVKHHKWTTFHFRSTEHWSIEYIYKKLSIKMFTKVCFTRNTFSRNTFTLQNLLAVPEWNLFKSKSHTKFISQSYNQRCYTVTNQFHWFLVLHLHPNYPRISWTEVF